jgi:hypothetical protein
LGVRYLIVYYDKNVNNLGYLINVKLAAKWQNR